jgi:hypothetical protein
MPEEVVPATIVPRGQSPEADQPGRGHPVSLPEFLLFGEKGALREVNAETAETSERTPRELGLSTLPIPENASESTLPEGGARPAPEWPERWRFQVGEPFDPTQPLMSYTRLFDGTDSKLTARLRDYVELNGDLRAGGWEAYLHRSEDFIRFTAHVMIVEMLQLHGGEARKRIVFKLRKYR